MPRQLTATHRKFRRNDKESDTLRLLLTIAVLLLTAGPLFAAIPADFDGDGKDDPVVWRESDGTWYIYTTSGSCPSPMSRFHTGCKRQWGVPGDMPMAGDFSGDGRAGFAVYRPSNRRFYVLSSNGSMFMDIYFGAATGDLPFVADFDGDRKSDLVLYRAQQRKWIIRRSRDLSTRTIIFRHGTPPLANAYFPAPADYDGDRKADAAMSIRSGATLQGQYRSSRTGRLTCCFGVESSGVNGRPISGDLNNDGRSEGAAWDQDSGVWDWQLTGLSGPNSGGELQWGLPGDVPTVADYDGDGKADFAVFRPLFGTWYIFTTSGVGIRGAQRHLGGWQLQWGLFGDLPLPQQPRAQ